MVAVLMFAAVAMFAQTGGGNKELKGVIQDLNNKMVGAIVNADYGKILTFYDANVISLPNYGKMLRGIDAIAQHQQQSAEMGNKVTALTLTTKKVMPYGDAVVEIGTFTITMEIAGMDKPVSDVGKYQTVWVKHDDTYKIISEIWNTNVHPMKALKGGAEKGDAPKSDPVFKEENKDKDKDKDKGETRSGKGKKPTSDKKGN